METPESVSIASGKELKKKKRKRVRFQEPGEDVPKEAVPKENVLVIPEDLILLADRNWKKDFTRQDLKYGRFNKEDDEKIIDSVYKYVKMQGWDVKEGVETVLHSSLHSEARGCWLEIAKCLPARPVKQINSRAFRLFGPILGEKRGRWSQDEMDLLKHLTNIYGQEWKKISILLGRSAQLCKDKWRHLKLEGTGKTGPWTHDELDKLCKLVRRSLRVKALIPPKTFDRRELLDDINWTWISEEMQRTCTRCADAWYGKLASPMVREKKWANGDDRLLLQSLMELGASSEEAVDWDSVLDHRDGETSMKRWAEMTRLLGMQDHASFEDKIEVLAKRFCPDLLGIQEE